MTDGHSGAQRHYYVVSVTFRRKLSDEERQAQRQYLASLSAQGALILTGPLEAPPDAAGQGMVLLSADSKDQAIELYSKSPVVREGLADWSVKEWRISSGRLFGVLLTYS